MPRTATSSAGTRRSTAIPLPEPTCSTSTRTTSRRGDRVYFQVLRAASARTSTCRGSSPRAGRFYLLPALQVTTSRDATVVVSSSSDPRRLHLRYVDAGAGRASSRSSSRGSVAVTMRVLALVAANVLMLGLGAGLLPLLRLARTPQELLARLPLAYAVGLAATGILAAELALVDVPVGWIALAAARGARSRSGCAASERRPRRPRRRRPRGLAVTRGARRRRRLPRRWRPVSSREAAAGDGRLADLGAACPGAVRVRPSGRAGVHEPALPRPPHPLWLPALEARRLPLHGRVRRHARPPAAARASRSRSSAAPGCSSAPRRRSCSQSRCSRS